MPQRGLSVRRELVAVNVDGEARLSRVVSNADDSVAVLEEVFENGEVGLGVAEG